MTIPHSISPYDINQSFYDSRVGINGMPYVIYKVLRLGELNPTSARLMMDDSSVKKLVGILSNVEIRIA